ncbi:hypothetical protein KZP23_08095 [Echinicola marina]|uniref:hypothetical protein n=1 Tax=Echinicola marina TaxID=2859768 RepID=UPI001CF63FA8|nr:hypothetical protein [Echinicola marina]UCS94960.1 hypothetical protein KZP23_08095 [Echinicola marina]
MCKYFNKQQLLRIEVEASKEIYKKSFFNIWGNKDASIFMVSNRSGLILTYGNSDTGLRHINERHSYGVRKCYWENDKIQDPTKFSFSIAPVDYLYICDQIYLEKNRIKSKHEQFEVYEGVLSTSKYKGEKFKLIIYSNSKVIHTFFQIKNTYPNRKGRKRLNLKRGYSSCSVDVESGVEIFKIPYFDSNNNLIVEIIMKRSNALGEDWFIRYNDEDIFIERRKGVGYPAPFRMNIIDFEDVRWIEHRVKLLIA